MSLFQLPLPEMVGVHVADVDQIGRAESVQGISRRFVEKPPAPGEGRPLQPGVEHEPPLSELQLHAGVGQVSHLKWSDVVISGVT